MTMLISSPDWATQVTDILVLFKKTYPFILLFLAILSVLSGCGELNLKEQQKVNEAVNDSLTSTTETWDVDMEIIEDGQKKVRLQGSYAATFSTDKVNETRIKGPVHIQVFDSTGAVKTRVTANRSIYRAKTSQFELFGDVHLKTRTNRRLRSEYLKWNQAENMISTPRFVIITTPSDSIAGSGFNGTTNLSSYTIKEPSGQVTLD